ncbi:MAG TPA: DCC1-like thiol-disulfide oxidoreductase family protein [Gaiella sp.]
MRDVTVLYDDRCALCVRLVRPLESLEGVSLAPIRSARSDKLLADLAPAYRDAALHVVAADGARRSGADALAVVLRRVHGGRYAAWLLERWPRAAACAYDAVARNRMRLSRPLVAAQTRIVSRR